MGSKIYVADQGRIALFKQFIKLLLLRLSSSNKCKTVNLYGYSAKHYKFCIVLDWHNMHYPTHLSFTLQWKQMYSFFGLL